MQAFTTEQQQYIDKLLWEKDVARSNAADHLSDWRSAKEALDDMIQQRDALKRDVAQYQAALQTIRTAVEALGFVLVPLTGPTGYPF